MRVLAWSAVGRPGSYVTGVGKHIVHMVRGLAERDNWNVRLLLTSDLAKRDNGGSAQSLLGGIPAVNMPINRRAAELLWRTLSWPPVDGLMDGCDWIYCPKELYVPAGKAKLAVTVHDLYHLEPHLSDGQMRGRFLWRQAFRRSLDQAAVVLAVSEFTKQRLVELLRIPAEKIRVVGNGVESEFFDVFDADPGAVSPLGKARYFLSVGGLTKKKGADDLVAFAEALQDKAPDLELVVTGPVEQRFKGVQSSASNIRLLARGFSSAEMKRLTRGALGAVILSEYEGFGIPVLEAMAAGVPVIAARRSALPEVVGDAGLLVDPKQPAQVCDAALGAVADEGLRREMIAKGRERARQFTWSACVERLASALEECSRVP